MYILRGKYEVHDDVTVRTNCTYAWLIGDQSADSRHAYRPKCMDEPCRAPSVLFIFIHQHIKIMMEQNVCTPVALTAQRN